MVVAYDALSPAAWHGMRCARRLGVPLIAVEEGFPSSGGFLERRLRGVGEALWGRSVRKQTDLVLALDRFAELQAMRRGFDPKILRVVPRGVDLEQFRPGLTSNLAARHGARGRSLLYLSPLEDGFHLEAVIQAFAATVGQREDWALLLAADGSLRSAFLAHASRLGVGARVHWLGRVRREELPGLMASSTVLVAPGGDRVTDGGDGWPGPGFGLARFGGGPAPLSDPGAGGRDRIAFGTGQCGRLERGHSIDGGFTQAP